MTTIAQLGFSIDSSQAATAGANLDKLVDAGARAEQTIADVGATSKATNTALGDLGAAAATAATAQERANQVVQAAGISAKQYAQSLRLLPVQIHQGFDQLLYGTNPLIVLATQLPQISESFGGIGNAIKALATFITPTNVAIAALAATIGAVGYEWYEAEKRMDSFRIALASTGDAAGLTVSQLDQLQQQIHDVSGASRNTSAAAITATLSAGITENVGQIAQLATELNELAKIPIAQTVKEFASLGEDPVRAAETLQRSISFLTPEVLNDAIALDKQGEKAKAAAVLQQALADKLAHVSDKLRENEGLWNRLKNSALGSSISAIGDQIRALGSLPGPGSAFAASQTIANQSVDQEQAQADQAKKNAAAVRDAIQNAQLAQEAQAAGFAAAQQAHALAITAQTDQVQRALQAELDSTQRYDQLLDAEHSAHLISDAAYYNAKKNAVDADTRNQTDAIQKQIALLQQQNQNIRDSAQAFEQLNPGPANAAKVTDNWTKANAELHANNEKILDDQAKLNQLVTDGASKVKLLGIEQAGAAKQAKDALDNLIASENQYLETLQRSHELQLEGLTAGPTTRQRLQDISQIDQQYLQQRQQLDQAKRINPELPNYDAQLKVIEDTHQRALADTDAYYKALDIAQSDWLNGAREALNTYEEDSKNVAGLANTAFTNAFQSMEDSIVNFATTGKFSFKDLADSILADLVRMEVKILESKALESIFGAFGFGGGDFGAAGFGAAADSGVTSSFTLGSIPGAATGGQISGPTIVGEAGPELFVPNQPGFVVPNSQLGKMGGVTVVHQYQAGAFAPGLSVAALQAQLDQRDAALKSSIANDIYRGTWKPILQKGLS